MIPKTFIKKLLAETAFDPSTPGPLASILESGDKNYFCLRAIELIRESLAAKKDSDREKALFQATQLLVMTRAVTHYVAPPKRVRKPKVVGVTVTGEGEVRRVNF